MIKYFLGHRDLFSILNEIVHATLMVKNIAWKISARSSVFI